MAKKVFTIPELLVLAGTRVALGVGVGLLISERLNKDKRKAAGTALLTVGALTTIPIVRGIFAKPTITA